MIKRSEVLFLFFEKLDTFSWTDPQLSWLEHQHGKLKARVQVPVQDRIFLFKFCYINCQHFMILILYTRAIQKVRNVSAYSTHTRFVEADHRILVFSVMLKIASCSCMSDLAMCRMRILLTREVRGVIHVLLHDNARSHTARQTRALLHEQF